MGEAASRLGWDCVINLAPYRAELLLNTLSRGSRLIRRSSLSLSLSSTPPTHPFPLLLFVLLFTTTGARGVNCLLPADITFPLKPFRGWWSSARWISHFKVQRTLAYTYVHMYVCITSLKGLRGTIHGAFNRRVQSINPRRRRFVSDWLVCSLTSELRSRLEVWWIFHDSHFRPSPSRSRVFLTTLSPRVIGFQDEDVIYLNGLPLSHGFFERGQICSRNFEPVLLSRNVRLGSEYENVWILNYCVLDSRLVRWRKRLSRRDGCF